MASLRNPQSHFEFLSQLLLSGSRSLAETSGPQTVSANSGRITETASALTRESLEEIKVLAMTNHVIMRAFEILEPILAGKGMQDLSEFLALTRQEEGQRIDHALSFLEKICSTLEKNGCAVAVIKSLDHWPDLGSDLDLYSDADATRVVEVMSSAFNAKLAERSWGDRLANKWNFIVPGLPEMIEIHIGRMGQTGEQTALTESLLTDSRVVTIGGRSFRVLSPEHRVVVSTMQRMYRHFYIRLCDVLDNALLLDARQVDFDGLHSIGVATGLWEGIATYMVIISQYVEAYRGYGVPLSPLVSSSAKFGVSPVRFQKDFLRVPILPHSLNLYAGELKTLLLQGQLRNSFRLSLLPGLATAAALEMKITGSDKGIW